jgi:hypothetical protein
MLCYMSGQRRAREAGSRDSAGVVAILLTTHVQINKGMGMHDSVVLYPLSAVLDSYGSTSV